MSLYVAARRTKQGINIGLGLLVAALILKLSWNGGLFLYNLLNPPEILPPQVAYGKIPDLRIESLPLKEGSAPRYRLETPSGTLPPLPDRAPVYKLRDRPTTLSFEKSAANFAVSLGFLEDRIEESSIDWLWNDLEEERTLEMNIFTGDFSIDTNLEKVAPTVPRGSAPEKEQAVSIAKSFLAQYQLDDDIINDGTQDSRYVQIKSGRPVVVESQAEAQMVEVNFFITLLSNPGDYPGFDRRFLPESFSVLSNDADMGVIQVFVTSSSVSDYRTPLVKYSSQRLNEAERSTYPIKRIDTAWEEVATGQARISNLRIKGDNPLAPYIPLNVTEVQIRSISLAYLDTGLPYRAFLQPIYVFEGEAFTKEQLRADYVAYVSAVEPHCQGGAEELGKPCG